MIAARQRARMTVLVNRCWQRGLSLIEMMVGLSIGLFLTLGLFWGISPSLYRHWGVLGVPVSHIIFLTGIGVAAAQVVWHGWLIRGRSREGCFKAFRLNHWVGAAVFAGTVLAGWVR